MSQQDQSSGSGLLVGGVAVFFVIGALALKAIHAFLRELAATFDAFGKAVESFFPMLLSVLQIVGLVAAIGMTVTAAVYFTICYVRLVKKATALQEYVNARINLELSEFKMDVEDRLVAKVDGLNWNVDTVIRRLNELLEPASPAPQAAATPVPTQDHGADQDEEDSQDPDAHAAQFPGSQPF